MATTRLSVNTRRPNSRLEAQQHSSPASSREAESTIVFRNASDKPQPTVGPHPAVAGMSSTEQASSPSATRKITSRYSVKRLVNSAQGLGARVVNSAPGFGALGSAQSGQPTSAVVNQGTHVPVSTQVCIPS